MIARGPGADGVGQWLSLWVPIAPATVVGWYRYTMVDYYLRYPNPLTRTLFPRSRWRAFWFAARRMVKGYTGRRYDGPVLAVFCEDGARREVWRSLLGSQSRQCDLTAAHDVLFKEPARGQWMVWLAEYLAEKR